MELWDTIMEKGPSLTRLWLRLDRETRLAAARALYAHDWDDRGATTTEANGAIAAAIHFRPTAVGKLPVEDRARYLALTVRPDGDLASSLLTALHFAGRTAMMGTFLDSLGVPHEDGLIDPDHDLEPPEPAKLKQAVEAVFKTYPPDEAELYLSTLYASDPETWAGLVVVMEARAGRPVKPPAPPAPAPARPAPRERPAKTEPAAVKAAPRTAAAEKEGGQTAGARPSAGKSDARKAERRPAASKTTAGGKSSAATGTAKKTTQAGTKTAKKSAKTGAKATKKSAAKASPAKKATTKKAKRKS